MSSVVNTLLEELFSLEPSLRNKEKAVRGLIEAMIANQPNVEINDAFRKELRERIMNQIQTSKKTSWNWWPMVSFACLCIVVGVWFGAEKDATHVTPIAFSQNIREVGQNGFGAIALSAQAPVARPQSGGGGPEMARLGNADAVSSKMMAPDMMIYPPIDMPVYKYSYKGDIKLPETSLPVYKKNNIPFSPSETNGILRNLRVGGINIGAFRNLGISNLTLTEESEYGYMVNLDFITGTISMYQNYQKWPQPVCDATGCTSLPKLSESDIPSDATIIAAAESFIKKYGIDISAYGAPQVDSSWRIWYARSATIDGEQMVPEMYTITYPTLLDGKPVYQEGGSYRGLTLTYDIRNKRISNMYGIEKTELEKSSYDTIQDTKLIQDMIQSGGRYMMPEASVGTNQKVVDITLGEPTLGYVHLFGEWKNGASSEYFVPAYIFPVENPPKDGFGQNTIIIPLIKEFTQTAGPMPIDPIVYSSEPVAEPAIMPKQ